MSLRHEQRHRERPYTLNKDNEVVMLVKQDGSMLK